MSVTAPAVRQAALSGLADLSRRELAEIWRKLNLDRPGALSTPLAEILLAIADKYGEAAAALAAEWYEEARDDAGMTGSFAVPVADLPESTRFDALARWGVTPLFGADPNPAAALTRLSGGLQRLVLDQARDTTFAAVEADPVRPRFARHASANACAFCALMATRGAVYASEADALTVTGRSLGGTDYRAMRKGAERDTLLAGSRARTVAQGGRSRRRGGKRSPGEKYHDDCHCAVVEVFPGQQYDEAPYVKAWRDAYAAAPARADLHTALSSMRGTLDSN